MPIGHCSIPPRLPTKAPETIPEYLILNKKVPFVKRECCTCMWSRVRPWPDEVKLDEFNPVLVCHVASPGSCPKVCNGLTWNSQPLVEHDQFCEKYHNENDVEVEENRCQ